MLSESLTLKPNFKVKTIRSKIHSSLSKMPSTKKDLSLISPILSIPPKTNPETLKNQIFKDSLPSIPIRGSIKKISEYKKSEVLD